MKYNYTKNSGTIQLIDGHSAKNIELPNKKLKLVEKTVDAGKSIERQLTITNDSDSQIWLEIRFCIPLNNVSEKELLFWDGYSERKIIKNDHMLGINADPVDCPQPLPDKLFPLTEEFKKKMLEESGGNGQVFVNVMFSGPCKLNVLPLCCVHNTEVCLGIGIDPKQLFSYQSSGVSEGSLYKSVKLVIDPDKSEQVTFFTFTCSGKYGFKEALDVYYKLFPDCYSPRTGIDPRLNGGAETSSCSMDYDSPELLLEDRRRFNCDWVWSMHAYSIEGVHFPRHEDYDPYGAFVESDVLESSYDEFIKYIQKSYDNGDKTAAIAYYILPQVLNEEFMRKNHPDAEWINSKGKHLPLMDFGAESHKDHSFAAVVLPWGSSYGKRCAKDMQKIAENIKPSAIAFDNVEGPRMDFAEHAQNCPGRAFTEGKVYVTQAIAYAKLMQEVRKQKTRRNMDLGVVGNHPGSYHTAILTDSAIVEHGPWTDAAGAFALRYDMGSKPIVYWGPKEFNNSSDYQGEALEEKLEELNVWLFLFSLRTGIYPNPAHNVKGYPFMQQRIPLLRKIFSAGWTPVPGAISNSKEVNVQRYGDEYLAVVNETESEQSAKIIIEKKYFSSDLESPIAIYGQSGEMLIENNNIIIKLQLPPRQAVVLAFKKQIEEISRCESKLRDFEFIKADDAAAQIIITNQESQAERFAAQRIKSYFKYYSLMRRFGNDLATKKPDDYQVYLLRELNNRRASELPILTDTNEAVFPNSIIIYQNDSSDLRKIIVKDNHIRINYTDYKDLDMTVSAMLKYLDEMYYIKGRKWFEMRRAQDVQESLLMGALR